MKSLLVTYAIAFLMLLLTLSACATTSARAESSLDAACFTPPQWKVVDCKH